MTRREDFHSTSAYYRVREEPGPQYKIDAKNDHFDLMRRRNGKGEEWRRVLLTKEAVGEAIHIAHHAAGHFRRDNAIDALNKAVWFQCDAKCRVAACLSSCKECSKFDPANFKANPPLLHTPFPPGLLDVFRIDFGVCQGLS